MFSTIGGAKKGSADVLIIHQRSNGNVEF